MLHGAGICTPTFTPKMVQMYMGKYSSTMEHVGEGSQNISKHVKTPPAM